MPYIPCLPYIPNIPYFPNMPYQTDHTHHTYPTYHTTPPPHHRGGGGQYHTPGRGTLPHPHHTTGGEGDDLVWGQYMGPIPWRGEGGWQGLVHIYIYIVNVQLFSQLHLNPIVSKGSQAGTNHSMCSPFGCGQPWWSRVGFWTEP